jgi:hypothetical protein
MSVPLDSLPPLPPPPILFRDTAVKGSFDTEKRAFYVKILANGHIVRNSTGFPALERRRISRGDPDENLVKLTASLLPGTAVDISIVLQTAEDYDLNVGLLDQ